MTYEGMILSASSGDGLDLRQFLGFERNYAHLGDLAHFFLQGNPGVDTSSLSVKNRSVLSLLFVYYRVLDIIAANIESDGHPELQVPIRYEKKKEFGTQILVRTFSFLYFIDFSVIFSYSIGWRTGHPPLKSSVMSSPPLIPF